MTECGHKFTLDHIEGELPTRTAYLRCTLCNTVIPMLTQRTDEQIAAELATPPDAA